MMTQTFLGDLAESTMLFQPSPKKPQNEQTKNPQFFK